MISSTQTNQPFTGATPVGNLEESFLETAIAKLREGGLRITQSRVQLLSVLGRCTEPMSVEELRGMVGADGCDLVTIYRSMMVFEQSGLVQRSYRYNGTTVFERLKGAVPRYRVFCKESKQFKELDDTLAAPVRQAITNLEHVLREQGYTEITHVVEFFAVRNQQVLLKQEDRVAVVRE